MRIRNCKFLAVGGHLFPGFATFAAGSLGSVVHDALVAEYLSHELIGEVVGVSEAS